MLPSLNATPMLDFQPVCGGGGDGRCWFKMVELFGCFLGLFVVGYEVLFQLILFPDELKKLT